MTRTITQGDKRSLRRIIRKHIVRSDRDFGMLRTEYIDRVEVDDMAVDLVGWADRRALRTAPAPAPSVVSETAVAGLDYTDIANRAQSATGRSIWPRTAEAVIAAALPLLTAAPSATREEVARTLAEHRLMGGRCRCGLDPRLDYYRYEQHVTDAVLDLLPGRLEAEVAAEALREAERAANHDWLAFKSVWGSSPPDLAVLAFANKALDWLRARAARLAAEGGADRG